MCAMAGLFSLDTLTLTPPQSPLAPNYRSALAGLPISRDCAIQHHHNPKQQQKTYYEIKKEVLCFVLGSFSIQWQYSRGLRPNDGHINSPLLFLPFSIHTLHLLCIWSNSTLSISTSHTIGCPSPDMARLWPNTGSNSSDVMTIAGIPLSTWNR